MIDLTPSSHYTGFGMAMIVMVLAIAIIVMVLATGIFQFIGRYLPWAAWVGHQHLLVLAVSVGVVLLGSEIHHRIKERQAKMLVSVRVKGE